VDQELSVPIGVGTPRRLTAPAQLPTQRTIVPKVAATGGPFDWAEDEALMVLMAAGHVAEVTVRRHADSPECDVVVVVREQKLVLKPHQSETISPLE